MKNGKDAVALLMKHKDIQIDSKNEDGCTPLHIAAQYNSKDAITELLRHQNIDVNNQDQ